VGQYQFYRKYKSVFQSKAARLSQSIVESLKLIVEKQHKNKQQQKNRIL